MTLPFSVYTTPRFDRLLKGLVKGHKELPIIYAQAMEVLKNDPYNRRRIYNIKKLGGVQSGAGQFRLRIERWRFRYDIWEQKVVLHYCGLRREDTYK